MSRTRFLREASFRNLADALEFQRWAADAYAEAVDCTSVASHRFIVGFQGDAAYFAMRARECLFELIGAEPELIAVPEAAE